MKNILSQQCNLHRNQLKMSARAHADSIRDKLENLPLRTHKTAYGVYSSDKDLGCETGLLTSNCVPDLGAGDIGHKGNPC